jgi:exonuclease VII large subunit
MSALERGYSITTDEQGKTLRRACDAAPGQTIQTLLHEGKLKSKIVSESKPTG